MQPFSFLHKGSKNNFQKFGRKKFGGIIAREKQIELLSAKEISELAKWRQCLQQPMCYIVPEIKRPSFSDSLFYETLTIELQRRRRTCFRNSMVIFNSTATYTNGTNYFSSCIFYRNATRETD